MTSKLSGTFHQSLGIQEKLSSDMIVISLCNLIYLTWSLLLLT
jgi:hypothetical protein